VYLCACTYRRMDSLLCSCFKFFYGAYRHVSCREKKNFSSRYRLALRLIIIIVSSFVDSWGCQQGCQVFSPLQCQIWLSIMPDLCQIMPDFFSYCQIFICVIEGIKQFNLRFQRRFHTYLEPFSLEFPKSDQIGKKIKKGPKIFLSLAEKDFADSSFSSPFQREGGGCVLSL